MAMKRYEIQVGRAPITIETGRMAKQADGAVLVRMGDTMVLRLGLPRFKRPKRASISCRSPWTTVSTPTPRASIPGGFFKREGKAERRRKPSRAA
jgi:polyribonucleotide nucleotidyltransferase